MSSIGKDSAQLEREVEAQRQKIEDRIGEIRERLSPGQLLDEALSYGKHGGQEFVGNLGSTISANPMPVALIGIGLAWLISGTGTAAKPAAMPQHHGSYRPESDYPYASVSGPLRRVAHAEDGGVWYSEFADPAGKRYKAQSNELGERAGHFVDETGKKIGGFIDDAGHRFRDFQDEAGNRIDEATGWASHTWHDVRHGVSDAIGQVAGQASQIGGKVAQQAGDLSGSVQAQADRMTRLVTDTFRDQPLIGGALAFALGAAVGAALPHTAEEDKAVGELADKLKSRAVGVASDVYEEGKAQAADLYAKSKDGVAKVYDDIAGGSGSAARPLN